MSMSPPGIAPPGIGMGGPPPGQPIQPQVIDAPKPVRKSYQSAKDAKNKTPFEIEIDGTVFVTQPGRVPGAVQIDFSGLSVSHDPEVMWHYFRCTFPTEEDFEAFKKTPIILMSAGAQYNDPRERAAGLLSGATMFLPKPITMEKLWAEIEDLFKSR